MVKNYFKNKLLNTKGFTLIELLMASGILIVLMGMFTGIFNSVLDAGLDSNATASVDQDGRYIIARLIYDAQRASQIVTPVSPGSTTYPSLTLKINSVDHTYSLDGFGNLQLNNDLGINKLNSYSIRIHDLTFQRIGIGDATDTVQVKFNITSKIQEASGSETRALQTTLGLQ